MWKDFILTIIQNPLAIKETHLILEIINIQGYLLGLMLASWNWLVNQLSWLPSGFSSLGPLFFKGIYDLVNIIGSGLFITWTYYIEWIQWFITPQVPFLDTIINPVTSKLSGGIGVYLLYLIIRWLIGI